MTPRIGTGSPPTWGIRRYQQLKDGARVVNFLSMGFKRAIEDQDRMELICAVMSTWWWALALQVAC
jgi:hypothetical protein